MLYENGYTCGWLDVTHLAGVLHRNYEELTLRDVLLAMAGMERSPGVGGAVSRPDAVAAFRHRYGLPRKDES